MSRMILHLHGALRRFPTSLNNGQIFGVFGNARSFATTSGPTPPPPPPPPPSAEPIDTTPTISVVLGEIRAQQKLFQSKVTRTNADVNAAHLEDNVRLEMLRGGASLPLAAEGEARGGGGGGGRLLLDPGRVSPLLAGFAPPTAEEGAQGTSPGRELRRPTARLPLQATVNVPRAPPPRGIVYPRSAERMQVNFRPPPPPPSSSPLAESVVAAREDAFAPPPPPPPPTGPRFAESTTHRIKVLLESATVAPKATDVDREKVEVRSRMLSIPKTDKSASTSAVVAPPVAHVPEATAEVAPLPAPAAPEQRLLTSVVMKQKFKVVPFDLSGKLKKSTTSAAPVGDGLQPEQEDGDDGEKHAHGRRWRRLKYTMAAFGVVATLVGGYLMIVVGSPKYDERGRLIRDQYSHLPLRLQYYNRVRDELENCNRMIKEPSRDKLLPDALEPPYYQPPYTLILEFTDLLVHPEWTYQNGWRFKKRPGVDQFLEALYTRFEVVVYTAQMGMTVFPIMDALDGKNLISYKLVRDATNFVDGDHVKDLDKLNRDLSKVVVVDWNESSVKLHKDNLFKIPRWEGNDDDSTLFDLAAFLIAISEWEVQDVRAVLQYYAQFENPLAKFKENQMQALQATQS